jgi:hypothetical protein
VRDGVDVGVEEGVEMYVSMESLGVRSLLQTDVV